MGLLKVAKIEKSRDHEEIFLDHYDWLLRSARDLCHGSREEADDLVQDLYVGFVQSKATVRVDDADLLRGYLYRVLKNLFIRKNRRNRDAAASLEISDFDSIQIALSSVDGSQLLLVRSRLTEICEYACTRRTTHKAGSVLILRFFFGYYPSEIAQLLRTTRAAVDKLTHTARLEVKAYLTRPRTLQFPHQQDRESSLRKPLLRKRSVPDSSEQEGNLPDDPAELKAELRERILSKAEGDCLSKELIAVRYAGESEQTLSTNELAHLVSCRTCLDTANDILGIPSLDMHFSSDDNEPDDQGPPSSSADGRRDRARQRFRRKHREAFEHRPAQLQVAVNGQVLGTTAITGEFNEFEINNLDMISRPEFVEVLSEQGITLASLDLLEVDGDGIPLQRTYVVLSDGRDLTIEITWSGSGPGVNVSYRDLPVEDSASSAMLNGPTLSEIEIRSIVDPPAGKPKANPWKRFVSWLASHWLMPIPFVVVGALLLSAGIYFHFSHTKTPPAPPTATKLLFDSSKAEEAAIPVHGAMHRTFAYEVRSDQGRVLECGTIDSLRGKTPSRQALRLLDRNGKIIAGHWVSEAGRGTDYPTKHRRDGARSNNSDAEWIHIPEAEDFKSLTGDEAKLTVLPNNGDYELSYTTEPATGRSSIVEAHLILATGSNRPTRETFRVQNHNQTREYQFEELKYELLPSSPQLESDFEPPADEAASVQANPDFAGRQDSGAHLTLEVLLLLSNLGPDIERIVDVERTPDGGTSINGVFETTTQRMAVERVFAPLRSERQLKVDLHAGDDPPSQRAVTKRPVVESIEALSVDEQRIPLDAQLRSALSESGVPEPALDSRIHAIANETLRHCSVLHREAWRIHQITDSDFARSELQSMGSEDRMLWLTLLDKHIRFYGLELHSLHEDLNPLLKDENPSPAPLLRTPPPIQTIDELRIATQTLNQDSDRLEQVLTANLTLSPSSLPANHKVDEVAQLLATMQTQESMLHTTIERLQMFGQADRLE